MTPLHHEVDHRSDVLLLIGASAVQDGSDPCQRAWLEKDVSQCGYCQPGMILELKALLRKSKKPTDSQIDDALSDHVCRCGSYPRIREAAKLAAAMEVER